MILFNKYNGIKLINEDNGHTDGRIAQCDYILTTIQNCSLLLKFTHEPRPISSTNKNSPTSPAPTRPHPSAHLYNAYCLLSFASTNGLKFDVMQEVQQKIVKMLVEEMFEESDQWLVTDI